MKIHTRISRFGLAAVVLAFVTTVSHAADPLPSWNEGATKKAIVEFVGKVTQEGAPSFVAPAERIATFDNDGTLWAEQPMYFQLLFALDRVKALAPQHPEWKTKEPFASLLKGDVSKALAGGEKALAEIVMATHAGMTTEEFATVARQWLESARHPKTGRPYTEMVYQPMLELLTYLRSNGFETYIVSGGGIEFVRAFAEPVYGIPPQNVVGTSIKTRYEVRDGNPVIVRLAEVEFVDDKAGKPVGIHRFIGQRPIAAFGNSDGDFEMLEWTTAGPGPSFAMIVHHDDAEREYAYDRESHVGKLARGLDEAPKRGWTVVSIKDDWRTIYPPPRK